MPEVRAALERLRQDVAAAHASGQRVVLLFYYSGHSDGLAFELHGDRWLFGEVRAALKDLGADIRVSIVDSCKSGALLAEKGATPGPSFDIRFTDDLATAGEAVLTSSAAHEMALESRELGASFFSHHLVSGLRGAADSSGDGRVTLGEAYRYAFTNTLLATSNTLAGPQHPAYDYRLAGQGELVLTEVIARGATLALPDGFDRVLIADADHRRILAELTPASAHRIALPAGRYLAQARRAGHAFEARFVLREGENRVVAAAAFVPAGGVPASVKGSGGGDDGELAIAAAPAPAPPGAPRLRLFVDAGVTRGGADALPWVADLRAGARLPLRAAPAGAGIAAGVEATRGHAAGFGETGARLWGGGFVSAARGALEAEAGWRVAAGLLAQSLDAGAGGFATFTAGTGPWGRLSAAVAPRARLGLVAGADATLLRKDARTALTLWPSLAAELAFDL
jgi:hypothetical protein